MSTIIKYTNLDNIEITNQQIKYLKDYKKNYLVDDVEKKVEIYVNNIIDELQYLKSDDEDINDIFLQLGTNSVTIITKEQYLGYVIKITYNYVDGLNKSKQKQLIHEDKIICDQVFSMSDIIDVKMSAKYMYDSHGFEIGEEIFSFHYNTDGTLNFISGKCYPFSEHNQFLKASEIQNYFPNLFIDNPYYIDSTFLPVI